MNSSSNHRNWRRFKRNKPALAALFMIGLAVFISLFAYIIAPDKSPNANEQILEIANERPGFSKQFLRLKKEETRSCSFFEKLQNGCPSDINFIPINSYSVNGDSILVEHYYGENAFPKEESYLVTEVADPPVIERRYLIGSDQFGRDLLSRLLVGTRISLLVGLVSVFISLLIGITLGSIGGYFGGKLDAFIMWLANVIWSLPTILLAMAIAFALRGVAGANSTLVLFIAIGFSMWVDVARIVRGQVMSVKQEPYVQAAQALGASTFRIITRHILPNIVGPIMVIAAANFAAAVLIEAGLSFIGIGISPPQPSWGVMLSENRTYLFTGKNAMMALAPGIAIMLLVISFNLLGNGLRDAFDVKGKN